jgi:hypothetical protein
MENLEEELLFWGDLITVDKGIKLSWCKGNAVKDIDWINPTQIKIYVEGLYCKDEYWFFGVQ